jgi:hypothetical protein
MEFSPMLFHKLKNLFGKAIRSATSTPPRRHSTRAPRARLGVEGLEARLALSSFWVDGSTLHAYGDPGDNNFAFTAGATPQVTLNNDTYSVDPTQIKAIVYDGGGGSNDTAYLTDSVGFETELDLSPNHATMTGDNYTLTVNNVANIIGYGNANATANLTGSSNGANTFVGTAAESYETGPDYGVLDVSGFGYVNAYAGTTQDAAQLYGSANQTNQFDFYGPNADMISASGANYQILVGGFSTIQGYAGSSADYAFFNGETTEANTFLGYSSEAYMRSSNYNDNALYNDNAVGFSQVRATAGTTSDAAYLYGSSDSANAFRGYAFSATLSGQGYSNEVDNFTHVDAVAGTSQDAAYLDDSGAKSTFTANPTQGIMTNADYYLEADNFASVVGNAEAGSGSIAYFIGSSTNTNYFNGGPFYSSMTDKQSYHNEADSFVAVHAYAGTTHDYATFNGLVYGNATFIGTPKDSYMYSSTYMNDAVNFRYVTANGTANDQAYLYASTAGPNTFVADRNVYADLYGSTGSYFLDTTGFGSVYAYGGGKNGYGTAQDQAFLYWKYGDTPFQSAAYSYVYGSDFFNVEMGFRNVHEYQLS